MNLTFTQLCEGEYILRLKAFPKSDTLFSAFGNHRHILAFEEFLAYGREKEYVFPVCIKKAAFQKQADYRDTSYTLTWEGNVEVKCDIQKSDNIKVIYTLGDSTVCNQEAFGDGAMYRCCGWGQALGMFSRGKYAVSNHAEQGTHTADCLSCHLPPVLEQLKKGDGVICQFGHNDQKNAFLSPEGGYYENLLSMGKKVMEKGGEFIICTPINRLIYTNGKINTYLDPWRDGAKKAAQALGVKCIDLHTFTTNLYLSLGTDAEKLFYHSPALDPTHPNDYGALKTAEFVAGEL